MRATHTHGKPRFESNMISIRRGVVRNIIINITTMSKHWLAWTHQFNARIPRRSCVRCSWIFHWWKCGKELPSNCYSHTLCPNICAVAFERNIKIRKRATNHRRTDDDEDNNNNSTSSTNSWIMWRVLRQLCKSLKTFFLSFDCRKEVPVESETTS